MKKKITLALIMLLTTQSIMAGKSSPLTNITYIYTYRHAAIFKIANEIPNEYNCTHPYAKNYLILDLTNPDNKEMYSAALAAFMSGSKVRIAYSGCNNWSSTATLSNVYRVDVSK